MEDYTLFGCALAVLIFSLCQYAIFKRDMKKIIEDQESRRKQLDIDNNKVKKFHKINEDLKAYPKPSEKRPPIYMDDETAYRIEQNNKRKDQPVL